MMPLTHQEKVVKEVLLEERLPFNLHHVFELTPAVRFSVDFLVFSGAGIVLECTECSERKGRALSELRRRTAFMNYRFSQLKASFPRLACGAVIRASLEDQQRMREELTPILSSSDFLSRSAEELRASLLMMVREENSK